MKLLKNAVILAAAVAMSSQALADDLVVADEMTKEVKEFRGFVNHGFSSELGGKLVHKMDLSEEQLAALELGLAELHENAPSTADMTKEEAIEAGVAMHLAVQALVDSILTDEQKAALEAEKAEKEAKRAEMQAEREAAKAEREAAKAEREAAKAAWEALSDEEKAALKAEKEAERQAEKEAKQAEWEAKKAEWDALTDEEKAALKEEKRSSRS